MKMWWPHRARVPARICVIRQGFYPLDPRVRREVLALEGAGYEVDVICLRRPEEAGRERIGKVTVHRVSIASRGGGKARYLFEYAGFMVVAAFLAGLLHFKRRFDVVQVNSMPDTLVFAAIVPKLLGAPVLLDLHECMPEFYAVKYEVAMQHRAVRILGWFEQAAIRFADSVFTCTDQMREAFEGRGAARGRIGVIMNSANEDIFDPDRHAPAARLSEEFRLICHGSIEPRYGIDTIVRAVARLKDDIPGLRLAIYGEGSALNDIQGLIRTLQVEDRVYVAGGMVPMEELLRAMAAADAGVVAVRRNIFRDLTHCNKMFDFITMRKPALVSRTRSVEAYFDDSCFQMFTSGDEVDLARAINELYSEPGLRDRLVLNALRANEPYRWPHQRALYLEAVERLALPQPGDPAAATRAAGA
jgi:glycosyltransferase involved in cell wall biosynthesis